MVIYDLFRIVHAAVTYLEGELLNTLLSLWSFGKHLLTKDRNRWLMFRLTILPNGRLYQRMSFLCMCFSCLLPPQGFGLGQNPRRHPRGFRRSRKNLDFLRTGLAKDCRNFAGGRINTRRILGAESLPRGSEVER